MNCVKRVYSLFIIVCILLSACKSTDCGCPMANTVEEAKEKVAKKHLIGDQKEWRVVR